MTTINFESIESRVLGTISSSNSTAERSTMWQAGTEIPAMTVNRHMTERNAFGLTVLKSIRKIPFCTRENKAKELVSSLSLRNKKNTPKVNFSAKVRSKGKLTLLLLLASAVITGAANYFFSANDCFEPEVRFKSDCGAATTTSCGFIVNNNNFKCSPTTFCGCCDDNHTATGILSVCGTRSTSNVLRLNDKRDTYFKTPY